MNGLPTSAVNLRPKFMAPERAGPGARQTEASGDVGGEETIGVNHLFADPGSLEHRCTAPAGGDNRRLYILLSERTHNVIEDS